MTKELLETRKVNDSTEVDLFLENGVYYLLVRSLLASEETEPLTMKNDEQEARKMLDEAASLGLIFSAKGLRILLEIKILAEVFGVSSGKVLDLNDIL